MTASGSAWATIEEVQTYTGIAVEQENILAAQAMVELFADAIYSQTANIHAKNVRLLKMAVAYQSAWISQRPDVFTNVDIGSMNQDGVFFTNQNANSGVLAPMAKRAIDRLSWRRNRSIKVRPAKRNLTGHRYYDATTNDIDLVDSYNANTPVQDDNLIWGEM